MKVRMSSFQEKKNLLIKHFFNVVIGAAVMSLGERFENKYVITPKFAIAFMTLEIRKRNIKEDLNNS